MIIRQPGQYLRERLQRFWQWIGVAVAVSVSISIVGWVLTGRRAPLWMAIALVPLGASIAIWRDEGIRVWLRRNRKGLRGEELVGSVLDTQLGREFRVLHDLDKRWGNVDHVVVGPTGVFAIETKAWTGSVRLAKNGKLTVGGWDREEAISQAIREAMWVRDLLAKASMDIYVEALIVLTSVDLPSGPIKRRQARVVTLDGLVDEIRSRTHRLSEDLVAHGANVVLRAGAPVEIRSMGYED